MNILKQTSWCLLVGLLVSSAWAQEAMKISLRTLQLGGEEMPESWVRVVDEKEPVKLTWLTTQPTEPLQVIHDGTLKLFRYSKDAEGKVVMEVIKSITLPTSPKEVLLLGWNSNGESKYIAIEDQFLNAKFNDWLAINTSVNPVALLAGDSDKPVRIDPGKSLIFTPKIEEGKGVKVVAQTMREDELKTFLSSYWPAFAKQRTMIIFYDDGEKMRAKRIGDRFVVKKEESSIQSTTDQEK